MSRAPLHYSDLCYHCMLSGLSCMHMQSQSVTGVLSHNIHHAVLKPTVGYKWKVGVRPCSVISGSGLTHCLITFQKLYLSLSLGGGGVGEFFIFGELLH